MLNEVKRSIYPSSITESIKAAAASGHEDIIRILIANSYSSKSELSFALPLATENGQASCMQLLSEYGGRFDLSKSAHKNALNTAITSGCDPVVTMLIWRHDLKGGDLQLPGEKVLRGLRLAAGRGLALTVDAILHAGERVDGLVRGEISYTKRQGQGTVM